jgi:hypothetical protein
MSSSGSYKYIYENIGHGWVSKLVDRHLVLSVDNNGLVERLNSKQQQSSSSWISGGPSGLVATCQSQGTKAATLSPPDIIELLDDLDERCYSSK